MAPPANPAHMPFFTFWVFYTHDVVSAGAAVGLGEEKDAVQPSGATSTKDIAYPVRLLPPLLTDLGNLGSAEQRDLHGANVISHEIGHCLGFDHVIEYHGGTNYTLPPSRADFARAVMAWDNLGPFQFTRQHRFGPVHQAMIARDYF
jgi:hypothetical protein